MTGAAVLSIDLLQKYLVVCCILNTDGQALEKLLKGFINLKAWLLISVHIDETERIMRTQKSLLILHAVQQECLNVWICLCGLISFLNALGLEIEALAVVGR